MNRATFITLSFLIFALVSILSIALYDRLPDPVPTHWNRHGVADGFTPKPFGAFLAPAVVLVLVSLLAAIPRMSPEGFKVDAFERSYNTIALASTALVGTILSTSILEGAGIAALRIDFVVLFGLGLLLAVIGNLMGKMSRNFFVGIRTPWTLANEEVWLRTHRVGGKIFVAGGLLLSVAAFTGTTLVILLPVVIALAVVPMVYSYFVYRKLQHEAERQGPSEPVRSETP